MYWRYLSVSKGIWVSTEGANHIHRVIPTRKGRSEAESREQRAISYVLHFLHMHATSTRCL